MDYVKVSNEVFRQIERRATMEDGAMKETPIRRVTNQIEKDLEFSFDLQKTLRERLYAVLNQQPKVEEATESKQPINASSQLFMDLDNARARLIGLNDGMQQLIDDLEI